MLRRIPPAVHARLFAVAASAVAVFGAARECLAQEPTGEPGDLRVMSFNVRYGTADDGDDAWARRRELVAAVIRDFGPDIAGLQEALRFQLDEIGTALSGYGALGVGRDDGREAGEYAAILYRAARFVPLDWGTFWLSDAPETPGSATWGNLIPRVCTWAILEERSSGLEFLVLNAHLDHESAFSRERAVALIATRAKELGEGRNLILMGDFNAPAASPPMAWLRGESDASGSPHLRDAFAIAHPDSTDPGTFHGFTGAASGGRIDAILVSDDWTVREAGIVRAGRDGRFPSDHFPVTAVLRPRR